LLDKATALIGAGYELFATSYAVEMINQELINFRDAESNWKGDPAQDELKIFKAYLAMTDKFIPDKVEWQKDQIAKTASKGGEHLIRTDFINILHLILANFIITFSKQNYYIKVSEGIYEMISRLIWPTLIKQHEFNNAPDAVLERFKGRESIYVMSGSPHEIFGPYVFDFYKKMGCSSGQNFLNKVESIILINLKRDKKKLPKNPADLFT
jgi:hypothetical protein